MALVFIYIFATFQTSRDVDNSRQITGNFDDGVIYRGRDDG